VGEKASKRKVAGRKTHKSHHAPTPGSTTSPPEKYPGGAEKKRGSQWGSQTTATPRGKGTNAKSRDAPEGGHRPTLKNVGKTGKEKTKSKGSCLQGRKRAGLILDHQHKGLSIQTALKRKHPLTKNSDDSGPEGRRGKPSAP